MINIYKASAGSGKTFTLAREYIKLILGHKTDEGTYVLNRPGDASSHRNVLAMTFTNKATEEMKSRIIHELAVLAGCEPGWTDRSPYEADLCKEFGCDCVRLAEASRMALRSLLYDFGRFSISTIDSFFQMVLRSFAHEAEVSSNYALELDDNEVIKMSVDQLLQSLNHGRPSRRSHEIETWITGYMKSLIEDGSQFTLFNRNGNVHDGLIKFIGSIHNDTFRENEKLIMDYLSDPGKFSQFRDCIHESGVALKEETARVCRDALAEIETSPCKDSLKVAVVNAVKGWAETGWHTNKDGSLQAAVTSAVADAGSVWKDAARKKGAVSPVVETLVADAMAMIVRCHESMTMLRVVRTNLYQMGLLSALMELIDRFRKENSTLLLSDTNSLLSKIIGDEDSPFLYERLGVRYHNYLIDEFQDTSLSQWANMRPLMKESLAYGYDNLVIGDEKQCIYRFRDSDPSLLHYLDREPWAVGYTVTRGADVSENTNWRSSADVVRFNNSLFSAIARRWGMDDVYSNVVQQVSSKHGSHRGYVRVKCFNSPEATDDDALAYMCGEMRRQLSSGYSPGDIAILVRRAKDGEKVIKYLEEVRKNDPDFPRFDIISDKSLMISQSDAVLNVISRLRLLSSSDVVVDKYHKSNREVSMILNDYERVLTDGASPAEALGKALGNMRRRASSDAGGDIAVTEQDRPEHLTLHGVDLVSLVESLVSALPAGVRDKENIYLSAFMDLVVKYVGQGSADIRSFLQWWDDTGRRASISGGTDSRALNILTVHKSKGLEFHCVHVPFAEFAVVGNKDVAWFELPSIPGVPDEILPPMMPLKVSSALASTPLAEQYREIQRENVLDRTNLLYVAFTRAVDELIVGVKVSKSITDGRGDAEWPSVAQTIYDGIAGGGDPDIEPLAFDDGMEYRLGNPTTKAVEEKGKSTAMRPSTSDRLPGYESTSAVSVWKNTNVDTGRLNRIEVARERGLILHGVMSHIRHRGDVDAAMRMLRSTPDARRLTSADMEALHDLARERVDDPEARQWFDGFSKVYVEREVLSADGELRRVDRVVWTADGEIHVIDYKTGRQDPRKYKRQVREYMEFFRKVENLPVRGFLYYLDSGEIVEITG
ncbi:MAG: UvrD-helicase domain-containing protein [Paenibacillus sp.]|nr:UvrD-helicase domain-containing protein [Paenibacillus sp.]